MKWRQKALVQNLVSRLPRSWSNSIYYRLQRTFGELRRVDPFPEVAKAGEIARAAGGAGLDLRARTILEVGTGRALNVPIGLYLCGAAEITSVDLNPYLRPELVHESLEALAARPERVRTALGASWHDVETPPRLERLLSGRDLAHVLRTLNLRVHAPADAGALAMVRSGSIDLHYSTNVFEHVPTEDIKRILLEARRVLSPPGVVVHRIDLTDHFSHSDSRISAVNFLQFDQTEWDALAGNQFMYHNRLRAYEFDALFREVGLNVVKRQASVDQQCLETLDRGLAVDKRFQGHPASELATTFLTVAGMFRT